MLSKGMVPNLQPGHRRLEDGRISLRALEDRRTRLVMARCLRARVDTVVAMAPELLVDGVETLPVDSGAMGLEHTNSSSFGRVMLNTASHGCPLVNSFSGFCGSVIAIHFA